jgi:hypothetical protein
MTGIMVRLSSKATLNRKGDLLVLHSRSANLRQMMGATFYLFGFVFFLGLQSAQKTLGDGRTPIGALILQNFLVDFAFGANVFLIFLILHSAHWFVSGRIRSYSLHLNGSQTPDAAGR